MASFNENEEIVCKVSDFGESIAAATKALGREKLANPLWLSPEIMRGTKYYINSNRQVIPIQKKQMYSVLELFFGKLLHAKFLMMNMKNPSQILWPNSRMQSSKVSDLLFLMIVLHLSKN